MVVLMESGHLRFQIASELILQHAALRVLSYCYPISKCKRHPHDSSRRHDAPCFLLIPCAGPCPLQPVTKQAAYSSLRAQPRSALHRRAGAARLMNNSGQCAQDSSLRHYSIREMRMVDVQQEHPVHFGAKLRA